MADGSILISTKLDSSEFQKGMKSLAQSAEPSIHELTKRIESVTASVAGISKSASTASKGFKQMSDESRGITLEKLARDLDNTNAKIEVQERLLGDLRNKYQHAVDFNGGAGGQAALEIERKILREEAALNKLIDTSDKTASKIWELEDAELAASKAAAATADNTSKMGDAVADAANKTDDLKESAEKAKKNVAGVGDKAGEAAGKVGKFGEESEESKKKINGTQKAVSGLTVVFADLVSKGLQTAIGAMKDMYDRAQELQGGMAMLATSAQFAGIGADEVQKHLRQLNIVSDDADASIESLSNLMQSGFQGNTMAQIIQELSGAVIAFPDTLKIESLADSLQETIASGEATGQFAELLGRVGVDVDDFNKKIARAGSETAKQQLVMNTLARTELPALSKAYQSNNKELIDNRNAQFEFDQALLLIGQEVMPVVTEAIQGLSQLLREHSNDIVLIIGIVSRVAESLITIISLLANIPGPVWAVIGGAVTFVTVFGKISNAVDGASKMFEGVPTVLNALKSPFLRITAIVLSLVAALAATAAIIAVLVGKGGELKSTLNSVAGSVGQIGGNGRISGYAKGTKSASPGPHWVGENGPELMWLNGGETIASATRSKIFANNLKNSSSIIRALASDNSKIGAINEVLSVKSFSGNNSPSSQTPQQITNNNQTYKYEFKVDDIATYQAIEAREKNRAQQMRQGVSQRYR